MKIGKYTKEENISFIKNGIKELTEMIDYQKKVIELIDGRYLMGLGVYKRVDDPIRSHDVYKKCPIMRQDGYIIKEAMIRVQAEMIKRRANLTVELEKLLDERTENT